MQPLGNKRFLHNPLFFSIYVIALKAIQDPVCNLLQTLSFCLSFNVFVHALFWGPRTKLIAARAL